MEILEKLKAKNPDFKHSKQGKNIKITCPACGEFNCILFPHINNRMICNSCKFAGQLADVGKELEPSKLESTKTNIPEDVDKWLNFYKQNNFDLVPVVKNEKYPIEKGWNIKTHKEVNEWKQWLGNGLNIGVKTGEMSNITVVDIDTKEVPNEIASIKGETLMQETPKGYHLFFKYEKDLPKCRIDDLTVDIENDGGQVVLYPSVVEGNKRNFKAMTEISVMPKELKRLLKNKSKRKTSYDSVVEGELPEKLDIDNLEPGNRNNTLIQLGGILRKELNLGQTEYVLKLFNHHFCEPSLPNKDIRFTIFAILSISCNLVASNMSCTICSACILSAAALSLASCSAIKVFSNLSKRLSSASISSCSSSLSKS